VVLCLLISLASCGGPHQIIISDCSAGNASIVFPADDQSQVDPYGTFRWPSSADVTSYLLTVGTQAGSTNVWSDTINHATSTRIPVLQPFTTYYVQLAAQAGSACSVSKTSFTTGAGLAHLKTPEDGAADVDPAVTFTWNGVVDAEMFQLELSTEMPGGNDQYESGELPNITSLAHTDLLPNTENRRPAPALTAPILKPKTTYFARMVTRKRGTSFFVDSTFTTGYGTAHLIRPSDGTGGVGPRPGFAWNRVSDAVGGSPYRLDLGSAPGLRDLWSSGWTSDTGATLGDATIAPHTVYYARLWTQKPGGLAFSDTAFSTGPFDRSMPVASKFLYPQDNQTDVDPLKPIVWSFVQNARYTLLVGDGTAPGVDDRNDAWSSLTTHTSWAGGLTGGTHYATLTTFSTGPSPCSVATPCQSTQRIKFSAKGAPVPHSVEGFDATITAATAAVRSMANGHDVPFPHTFLINNWDNQTGIAVCSDFANNLTAQLQSVGIVSRRRDSIFGLGPLAHSLVGYHNVLRQAWEAADAMFGMVFSDPAVSLQPLSLFQIADRLNRGDTASIPVRFVTTKSVTQDCPECFGHYWVLNSSVDPMILYLNPTSYERGPVARHDATRFLIEYTGQIGVAGTYIFRFQSLTDSAVVQDQGGAQYLLTPTSPVARGANFSQQLRPGDGWFYATPPPAGMEVYKLACPVFDGVACH
jgi:hypothetical protein